MLFLIITLVASWGLIWVYDRQRLDALGFILTWQRAKQLGFGLLTSTIVASAGFLLVAWITDSTLSINPGFTPSDFVASLWWMFKSVITEELLFRGAALYVAIRIIGAHPACLLSAVAFGIYHWFSYNVLGNPVQMVYTFMITGVGGLMFAYAFAFTKSVYMPVGLHLAWNVISAIVFSQGPLGNQLLIVESGPTISWLSIPFLLYQVCVLPAICWWWVKREKYELMKTTRQERLVS